MAYRHFKVNKPTRDHMPDLVRDKGDMPDPKGGLRGVIPEKQKH